MKIITENIKPIRDKANNIEATVVNDLFLTIKLIAHRINV